MSLEFQVMDFLREILNNSMIKTTISQVGFTPHDKIMESQLPFMQVFDPLVDGEEEAQQQPGTMTCAIQIFDLQGRKDKLRDVLEALDSTLRIDSSFEGLVKKGFVSSRSVVETGEDKRTFAVALVVVEFKDQLLAGSRITGGGGSFTELVNLRGDLATVTISEGSFESSKMVKGTMGIRRVTPSTLDLRVNSLATSSPHDLSGVFRVRVLLYVTPEYATDIANSLGMASKPDLSLFTDTASTNGGLYSPASERIGQTKSGWSHFIYNIDAAPDTVIGAGLGTLDTIRQVQLTWSFAFAGAFSSTRFGLIWAQVGYHLRDTGPNTPRGFHSDL